MWKVVIERGPAIGIWCLAMAAQVSGFNNTAIALFLLGGTVFFLVAPAVHHGRAWQRERKTRGQPTLSAAQISLLVGVAGTWLFMTAALGAFAWMIWNQQGITTGAIAAGAKDDEGPLQFSGGLGVEWAAGQKVGSIRFLGVSISKTRAVELKEAVIVSRIDGSSLPLEIVATNDDGENKIVPISKVRLIPPGARVELVVKFGPPDPKTPGHVLGIEQKAFLDTWRQFSLIIKDDVRSYQLEFNDTSLMAIFQGKVGPRVTVKPNEA